VLTTQIWEIFAVQLVLQIKVFKYIIIIIFQIAIKYKFKEPDINNIC